MKQASLDKTWELQLAAVNRQEAVDSFCEACTALTARDRRKVECFLKNRANANTKSESAAEKLWSKSEMRACYDELRNISPNVATAWRRFALGSLEIGLSGYYVRLNFQVLADSLECRMWIENFSDD